MWPCRCWHGTRASFPTLLQPGPDWREGGDSWGKPLPTGDHGWAEALPPFSQERLRERAGRERLARQLDADGRLKSAVRLAAGRAKVAKSVDVCFVFDCTKSMKPHLQAAKERLCEIQHFLLAYMGEQATVRFAFVGFRDYASEEPLTVHPFTESSLLAVKRLASLRLESGQDVCEDVLGGLRAALRLDWRAQTRVVYLVCDSPGHGRRFHDLSARCDYYLEEERQWGETDAIFESMRSLRLHFVGLQLDPSCAKMFRVFRALHGTPDVGLTSEVKTLSSTAIEFVTCVTAACSSSVTSSLTLLKQPPQGPARCLADEHTFELQPLDWAESERWPMHPVLLTSFALQRLSSEPREARMVRSVRLCPRPFSEGAMRFAFPAVMVGAEDMKLVVKVPKRLDPAVSSEEIVRSDVLMQAVAQYFARQFSRRLPDMPLQFVHAQAMRVADRPDFEFCAVEPFIPGQYEKYTSNAGFVSADSDVAQAFSHFTWHFSGGDVMVTDIQGVSGSVLTDPQIHSVDKSKFGRGNLGIEGMDYFFMFHKCNDICRALNLKSSPLQIPGIGDDSEPRHGPRPPTASTATPATTPEAAITGPGPLLCQGQCGAVVAAAGEEYLECVETYGGIFCGACQAKVRSSTCTEPCASPECPGNVTYSLFVLGVMGIDPPMLCRTCTGEETEWTLLGME